MIATIFLKALPNLVNLVIDGSYEDGVKPCQASDLLSLRSTRLQTLTIKHGDVWVIGNVAAFIAVCPCLQALHLYGLDRMIPAPTFPIIPFGVQLVSLTMLTLSNMGGLNDASLLGLVDKLPSLTHLAAEDWNEATEVETFEASPAALATLMLSCPRLRELRYVNFAEM